jgi:hypothetical protein
MNLQDANILQLAKMYIFAVQNNSHLICHDYSNKISLWHLFTKKNKKGLITYALSFEQ